MRNIPNSLFAFLAGGMFLTTALAQPGSDPARPNPPDSADNARSLFSAWLPLQQELEQLASSDFSKAFAPRFFLDYDIAYSGSGTGSGYMGAVSSHGARLGRLLFYNEFASLNGGPESVFLRGNSGVALDWPASRTRVTLGDVQSEAASDLGQGIRLGGISIKRGGGVAHGLVSTPVPAFARETAASGEVEIYVDGVRMYHAPARPGGADLRNVARFAGLRQVDVVTRDASGREIRTTRGAYRADRMLARGASEFEYSLGAARLDDTAGGRYGRPAFVASHRHGISNHVTIGAHADGIDSDVSGSLGVGVRLNGLGMVSGEFGAASEDTGAFAPAGSVRYSHSYRGLHMTAGYKRAASTYPSGHPAAQELGLPSALVEDLGAKFSYSREALGTITFTATRSSYQDQSAHVLTTLAYSYVRPRRWGIDCLVAFSTGQRAWSAAEGWTAFVNLTLHLEEPAQASLSQGSNLALPVHSALGSQRSATRGGGQGWDARAASEAALRDGARSTGSWDSPVGTVYGNVNPGDATFDVPPSWQLGWSGSIIGSNGVWARRHDD